MVRWVVGSILHGVNPFVVFLLHYLMIYSVHCRLNLLFIRERDVAHGAMGRRIDSSWSGPICCVFITLFNR